MSARTGLLIATMAACGSSGTSPMYPAGSDKDDGYGDLAQQSARLLTRDGADPVAVALQRPSTRAGEPYGGDPYGGAIADAADPDPDPAPAPPVAPAPRARPYRPIAGLTGSVSGTVTWRGAPPPAVVTACGTIEHPAPHVAGNHRVGGVLVTIEPLATGRVLPSFAGAATIGGTVTKRGCVLAPTLQIVTPLPASLAIHGDARAVQLLVHQPASVQAFELLPAGRVVVPAQPGVTRVEAADGSIAAAWVIATETPYYAITDDDGRFRIGELAAGTYDLTFWRAPLPTLAGGKLVYGAPVTTHRSLRVDAVRPAHLDVLLER